VLVSGEPGHPAKLLATLGSAPSVVVEEPPGAFLVLTTKGLLRVKATGAVENLGQLKPLWALYPNSMVRAPSGVLFVGMRHFVARLTLAGGRLAATWLVPSNCKDFAVEGMGCKCGG
jgi:hypothetical protein